MPTEHAFPDTQVHFKWDVGNEPALVIQSRDSVTLESRDVSDNQITPSSTAADIGTIDWDRVYPLAGPIGIDGAEPGDTLAVEIVELRVQDWGWTAIIPGSGSSPTSSRPRTCGCSTSRTASTPACGRTSRSRSSRSSGRWASVRPERRSRR